MTTINTGLTLSNLAAAPASGRLSSQNSSSDNWFEAFANAWGQALDKQASVIEQQSGAISEGGDQPSDITKLTAESMKMSFLSESSHSSIDSVSKSLETMARKS
ncbi:hypothetical protein PX554_17875 [Sphingomonas sp. H39-1-10]|uniref:hypothetical protein n=1 Tax=Sphingomonas TaxID=13687 RepID=UPI000889BABC|nr:MULTISPECIES: hypothetical protein [Sphingomonas]MDF0490007.1 hypothetical protein [Sphingomonas pollutisoli]SDA36247.1 hypothetical protein SAMN03159340_03586 [Sphingomonas sp. NFR15]